MTHHTAVLGGNNTAVEGHETAADQRLWVVKDQSMGRNSDRVATFRSYLDPAGQETHLNNHDNLFC